MSMWVGMLIIEWEYVMLAIGRLRELKDLKLRDGASFLAILPLITTESNKNNESLHFNFGI